ncbi:PAS domain S-box protein, partial [candidate division KSB1 bacterium]
GKDMHRLLAPKRYVEKGLKAFSKFAKTGKAKLIGKVIELTGKRRDGTEFPFEVALSSVKLKGKWNAIGIITDITERKEAEQAVKKSEERLNRILTTSYEGFWFIDNDTVTLDANPAMCAILGRSREEITGRTIFDFVDEKNQKIFNDQVKQREKGKEGAYEIELLRADGTNVPCLFNATPFTDDTGKKTGSFAWVTDITEQKEKERAALLGSAIGDILISPDPFHEKLQACTEAFVQEIGAAFSRIWTVNEEEQVLELQASAGLYTHIDGKRSRVEIGKKKVGKIARNGRPYFSYNVTEDPEIDEKEWVKEQGLVSAYGYPMKIEEKVVGVLVLFSKTLMKKQTLDTLSSIANAIGMAIERERAEEELKERMDDLERFSRLTVNREEKMIQLKEEINTILVQIGKEQKYKIVN